ncbi:cytochrome P450 [Actinomadura sp. DC4]|uniref:cytochrome P450 n=1 Tax=Actinomadura sp. DC4 TaxID=3055069 RepID=UPI0025B03AFB|nr:cytochrome P450 [Actinomadura sp. DC4]MDN3354673.1 cytochrome P450 [Actinomadura sp. DC4]
MTAEQSETGTEPPPGCPAHEGGFPLHGPDLAEDPHAVYARLREQGVAVPVELSPGVPATLIVGYDAALDVLRDPTTFRKDPRGWQKTMPDDCPVLPMMMYRPNCRHADGSAHSRLRAAVTDSLARVDMFALRGYVEQAAGTLIARFAAKGVGDLVADYARALPLLVSNEMLGCPPEIGDRLVEGMSGIFDTVDARRSNEILRDAVVDLVRLKRAEPAQDITSWLAEHPVRLSDEEMLHQITTLLGAGTEPTQNLIVNGLRLLLSDARFAGDLSGGNLQVEDAIDEVLWTDPPMANFAMTYPVQDVDFAGVRLPKDQPVVISLAAANTDPALATDHREGNRAHLAWSAGPHTCPAQAHARLIASAAIEAVLDALPEMELAVPAGMLKWRPGPFHRALTALPVNFPPVAMPGGEIPPELLRRQSPTPVRAAAPREPRPATDWTSHAPDGLAAVLTAPRPPARRRGISRLFHRR